MGCVMILEIVESAEELVKFSSNTNNPPQEIRDLIWLLREKIRALPPQEKIEFWDLCPEEAKSLLQE